MRKITEECKEKLQHCLKNYIEDTRGINREKKFRCFNCGVHNNGDSSPSATIVPGSKDRFWTCFACGERGIYSRQWSVSKGLLALVSR